MQGMQVEGMGPLEKTIFSSNLRKKFFYLKSFNNHQRKLRKGPCDDFASSKLEQSIKLEAGLEFVALLKEIFRNCAISSKHFTKLLRSRSP